MFSCRKKIVRCAELRIFEYNIHYAVEGEVIYSVTYFNKMQYTWTDPDMQHE